MRIEGTVLEAKGPSSLVAIFRSSACGGDCGHNCAMCAAAKRIDVVADNGGFQISKGDKVMLESSTRNVLGLAALVYLLPLAIGVIGYYTAAGRGEGPGVLAAFIGFCLGFIPAVFVNRRMTKNPTPTHTVVSVSGE